MDKSKILIFVIAGLVVVSIVLSLISFLKISSIAKSLKPAEEVTSEAADGGSIPVTETINHKMAVSIIAILPFEDQTEYKTLSVSVTVAFRILKGDGKKSEEKATELDTLITDNEGIIGDRVSKLLKTKVAEDLYGEYADEAKLQTEIKDLVNEFLATDLIVDVYFDPLLASPR